MTTNNVQGYGNANNLLDSAMEHKVNVLVYTNQDLDVLFGPYGSENYVITDDGVGNIEDLIMNPSDTRTIIYRQWDDTIWNKIFTMLLAHPEKHIIIIKDYNIEESHRIDMKIETTQLLKAIIAL